MDRHAPERPAEVCSDADGGDPRRPPDLCADSGRTPLVLSPALSSATPLGNKAKAAYATAQRAAQQLAGGAEGYYRAPPPPFACLRLLIGYRVLVVAVLLFAALRPWRWSSGPSSRLTAEALEWGGARARRVTRLDEFVLCRSVMLRAAGSGRFLLPDGSSADTLPRGLDALRRAVWRVEVENVLEPAPRPGRHRTPRTWAAVAKLRPGPAANAPQGSGLAFAGGSVGAVSPAIAWTVSFPRQMQGHAAMTLRDSGSVLVAAGGGFGVQTASPALLTSPYGAAAVIVQRVDFSDDPD
eukprot:TRINITY_DN24360_c0_g1_i1.p1 TRINITY_DN24360_c0_g1~~TRINITY_DN24360_c0_g1_i1.p1  ORF type:complete len:297 (+),score=113.28 TRINITY_DN24360_c0_g1_i1:54-944(+)